MYVIFCVGEPKETRVYCTLPSTYLGMPLVKSAIPTVVQRSYPLIQRPLKQEDALIYTCILKI